MWSDGVTARRIVAATLLLTGLSAAVGWHAPLFRVAQAASEAFTIPLADEGAAPSDGALPDQPLPDGAAPSAPPPPLLSQPETAPATPSATTLPTTETEAPTPAPVPAAGETTPQAASRDAGDVEAMLRKLMADDSVVAIVDGKAILWGEVWRSAEELPSDYRGQPELLFPALLRRAVDMILLTNAARREDLQKDPEIRRQVAAYEEQLLRERLLRQRIDAAVTDDKLKELYYQELAREAASVEVTARHIQLDSEAEARAVIAELDQGADFATLAHERSRATSGKQGGSLGSFRLDRMPPSFAAAIAKLQPGDYSREPAQSEFGWHVIKLESREGAPLPSFAELAPGLRKEAERKAINDLLQELRERAKIEVMPLAAGEQAPQ